MDLFTIRFVRLTPARSVNTNPTNSEILRGYAGRLFDRIHFVEAAAADTAHIDRGLLFVMAFWSGPAVIGFKNICAAFEKFGLPSGFIFRVLDIDAITDSMMQHLMQFQTLGGAGEGYWFRAGQIFDMTMSSTSTEERVQQLIRDSAQA